MTVLQKGYRPGGAKFCYPTLVGIALPIQDLVGEDSHVIRFWEETVGPIPIMENPAAEMYNWLTRRLRERSQSDEGNLSHGMPGRLIGLPVRACRDGHAGYILYEPVDRLAANLTDQPIRVQIECQYGFAKLGIGDRYTLRMLAQEFWALARNEWLPYPGVGFARLTDGTIPHSTTSDPVSFQGAMRVDLMAEPPVKIRENAGRGTVINSGVDQA
jgi:hypothetical protein